MKSDNIIMTYTEAIKLFTEDKFVNKIYLRESELYRQVDLDDKYSIIDFLDNEASDIHRLTEDECRVLGLRYATGYYINEWDTGYLEDLIEKAERE